MRRGAILIIGFGLSLAGVAACAPRSAETVSPGQVTTARAASRTMSEILVSWPEKQRETANALIVKYGQPTVKGDGLIAWFNSGPFVQTILMRDGQPHNFPMPHVDYLTQTIKHTVPADKLDELYQYDGSVWFHRTRGELSAQCDVEAMNFLALNLAHDILTGKRSVSDARAFYARTAMAFKQGDRSSPYVTGLIFRTEPNAADPDRPHQM
jgi:hypothetical protein